MREIKFRAYIKRSKVMVPVADIDFEHKEAILDVAETAEEYAFLGHRFDEVELMQFTGLHDKNGREIYEGDILRNKIGVTAEIKFSPEHAAFTASYKFQNLFGEEYLAKDVIEMSEVIGNIHKHPHLLNKGEKA